MKTSSAGAPPKAPDRTTAVGLAMLNQGAAPGLGSFLGGHRIAGSGQLLLSMAGFSLVTVWFVRIMSAIYQQFNGPAVDLAPIHHIGKTGGLIFAVGWFWAWISSLQILRAARRNSSR